MELITYVGGAAAVCTTAAFIPQIAKILKQGAEDLSYGMLLVYIAGTLLWLAYGLMIHSGPVIWANGLTSFLVAVAIVLKAVHAGQTLRDQR